MGGQSGVRGGAPVNVSGQRPQKLKQYNQFETTTNDRLTAFDPG